MQLNDWNGLSADEKDGFVTNLVEYGTDFVAPLYSVVEKIEETLQEKNSTIRAQADARPVAHEVWGVRIGDSDVWAYMQTESDADFIGKQSGLPYEKRRYTHPEASAPGLSGDVSSVRAALIGLANHVRAVPAYSKLLGDMEQVDKAIAILTRASAATVDEQVMQDAVNTGLGIMRIDPTEVWQAAQQQADKAFKVVTWSSATDREFASYDEALAYIRSNAPNDWHIEAASQSTQQQAEPVEADPYLEGIKKRWPSGEQQAEPSYADSLASKAVYAAAIADAQQAEPHPSQAHPTFQTVSLPNGPGTPSAQTFDRRIACKAGKPEWKSCAQQAEPGADERGDAYAGVRLLDLCRRFGVKVPDGWAAETVDAARFALLGQIRGAIDRVHAGERDAIARSKSILEAVDTYCKRPDRLNRLALRSMLVDEFTELLAAQSGQRAGVAEGWQLVPVKPTEQMQIAGRYATHDNAWEQARAIWGAMLAAAPTHHTDQS